MSEGSNKAPDRTGWERFEHRDKTIKYRLPPKGSINWVVAHPLQIAPEQ
jgi:hypothetical protein